MGLPQVGHLAVNYKRLKDMNEQWRAQGIGALSAGLAPMSLPQRQRMYEAAVAIVEPQHQGWVLQRLGAEMKHLLPEQQDVLFNRAMALSDPEHLARALAGLARSIGMLGGDRTETVFMKALQLPERNREEMERKEEVVCALATQLEHLSPTQREHLVAVILQGQSFLAFKALMPGLGHVAPEQQHQLLQAVAGLFYKTKASIVAGDMPIPRLDGAQCSALQAKPAVFGLAAA